MCGFVHGSKSFMTQIALLFDYLTPPGFNVLAYRVRRSQRLEWRRERGAGRGEGGGGGEWSGDGGVGGVVECVGRCMGEE